MHRSVKTDCKAISMMLWSCFHGVSCMLPWVASFPPAVWGWPWRAVMGGVVPSALTQVRFCWLSSFPTWLLTFRSCLTHKSKTTQQLKFGQENILRNMDEFYKICSLFAFTFKWLLAELVRTGCVMLQNKNPSTRCISCPWCISNTGQWVWRNNLSHTAPQELRWMGAMNFKISKFAQPSGILGPVSSGITEKTSSGLVWGLGLLN